MIQVSWGTVVGFVALVALIGPGLIFIGRISNQVKCNTANIKVIFEKLDTILECVRKG